MRSGRPASTWPLPACSALPCGALAPGSPLWALPNVIVTPHSAGHSDGNAPRADALFLANLGRWIRGEALASRVA